MRVNCHYIRIIATILSLVVFSNNLLSQHNWTLNVSDFEKTGEIKAIVLFDDIDMVDGALGAFVGDECRGIAENEDILYFAPTGKTIFSLFCYSNVTSGETLTFKYYNPDDQKVYAISESVEFVANMTEGSDYSPLEFHVLKNSAPVANCPDKSDLEAPPGPITFNLCEIFSDPDNDLLTFDEVHSDGSNVSWLSGGCMLEYTTAAAPGTYTLTLSASDGSLSAQCEYSFTIGLTNTAPVVTDPVKLITLNEGFGTYEIDLDTVFNDADGDELSFSSASSDSDVIITSITGTILSITEQGSGNARVTVSASDMEYSVSDKFTVVVVDDGPAPPWSVSPGNFQYSGEINAVVSVNGMEVTSGTLAAFVGNECRGVVDGEFFVKDGRTVFPLICYSNSNSYEYLNFKYKSLNSNQYFAVDEIVEFKPDMLVGTADSPVSLSVSASNNMPVVDNPIADQQFDEHFSSTSFNLMDVFSDPDSDPLTFSAKSSNKDVAVVLLASGILSVFEVGSGSANITVSASDGVFSIEDHFSLTINEVNDPPAIINPIPDQDLQERFGTKIINISSVFKDPDGEVLEYSVSSTDENVVTVSLSGPQLIIKENKPGTATVNFCAKDATFQVCDDFLVNVKDINLPPETDIGPDGFPDRSLISGFGSVTYEDICLHFSDPDNDALTYSVSSSNPNVVMATISGCDLQLSETGIGVSTVSVCASDANFKICFSFTVTVFPQNTLDVFYIEDELENEDTVRVSAADTTVLLIVHSAIRWEVESTANWFSASKLNIFNAGLYFEENTSILDRTGSFSVRDTQQHVLHFVLLQEGKPDGIDQSNESFIRVYPNPVKSNLHVLINRSDIADCQFELYSPEGRILRIEDLIIPQTDIDISMLESGMYFLRIKYMQEVILNTTIVKL